MHSISHRYKVLVKGDQSPTHTADNIANKSPNPNAYWRSSKPIDELRVELNFTPVQLHKIEVVTSASPQIEIEAYNRDTFGDQLDVVVFAQKTELIPLPSFLKDTESLRCVDIKPFDTELFKERTFTHLSVTLSNPYHDRKPVRLNLMSLVIYGMPVKFTNQLNSLEKASNDTEPDSLTFHPNGKNDNFGEYRYENPNPNPHTSFITQFGHKRNAERLEEEYSKERNLYPKGNNDDDEHDLKDLLNNFTYTKKVKQMNSKPPSTNKDITVDLTASLENNNNDQNPNDNNNKMKIEGEEDEWKKAIEESKMFYALQEKSRHDLDDNFYGGDQMHLEGENQTQEINESVEPAQYNKILDQLADIEDDISATSVEKMYNEASNKIEDDRDDLTEPLGSMADADDDYQRAFENEMMEEENARAGENKTQITTNKKQFESSNKSPKENSNKSNKYWDFKSYNHGQPMFNLTANELSQDYIRNETRARLETEKGYRAEPTVKVTTSLGEILQDVVFSLSGFVNPDRQMLRDNATSMGARWRDDLFEGETTHLICSSKNNGKYNMAKKFKSKIYIVRKEWIEACYSQRKRVDEKYYEFN